MKIIGSANTLEKEWICIRFRVVVNKRCNRDEVYKKRDNFQRKLSLLWYLPDLNWGHTDFQSVALPTELRYPVLKSDAKLMRFFTLQKEYHNIFNNIIILMVNRFNLSYF